MWNCICSYLLIIIIMFDIYKNGAWKWRLWTAIEQWVIDISRGEKTPPKHWQRSQELLTVSSHTDLCSDFHWVLLQSDTKLTISKWPVIPVLELRAFEPLRSLFGKQGVGPSEAGPVESKSRATSQVSRQESFTSESPISFGIETGDPF